VQDRGSAGGAAGIGPSAGTAAGCGWLDISHGRTC
jgi:hypothetical protein